VNEIEMEASVLFKVHRVTPEGRVILGISLVDEQGNDLFVFHDYLSVEKGGSVKFGPAIWKAWDVSDDDISASYVVEKKP